MKVDLEKIRLAVAAMSGQVYAGTLNKNGMFFKNKINLEQDFLKCIIEKYGGYETIITSSGSDGEKYYKLSVKEITATEKEQWERELNKNEL